MAFNVIVNGAKGRMGMIMAKAIADDPELNLVASNDHGDNLAETIKRTQANIVVDFTRPDCVYDNTSTIIACDAHPVIGTSGLLTEQRHALQERCQAKKLGGIIAANFSIAAVLMMQAAQQAARYLPHVEIIELHHDAKQDAPSGTAIHTAELLQKSEKNLIAHQTEVELLPGARGANHHNVHIHSVRLPGLFAHQSVILGGTGETLTIHHDAINRDCMTYGVLLACKKVTGLSTLVHGLEHIL